MIPLPDGIWYIMASFLRCHRSYLFHKIIIKDTIVIGSKRVSQSLSYESNSNCLLLFLGNKYSLMRKRFQEVFEPIHLRIQLNSLNRKNGGFI